MLLLAGGLMSGPLFPWKCHPDFVDSLACPWSQQLEDEFTIRLVRRIMSAVASVGSPERVEASLGVALLGQMVANAYMVFLNPDGQVSARSLGVPERRKILLRLSRLSADRFEAIESWALQSLLNGFVHSPFSYEHQFDNFVKRVLLALGAEQANAAVTAESPVFRRAKHTGRPDGISCVVAKAWTHGLVLNGAMPVDDWSWEIAGRILGRDVSRFSVEVGTALPARMQDAMRIAACGCSHATRAMQEEVIATLSKRIESGMGWSLLAGSEIAFVVEVAMEAMLRDASWENKLRAAVSASAAPNPALASSARRAERESEMRATRLQFAELIANNHGRVAVWEPLFLEWGVLDSICVESGAWADLRRERLRSDTIEDVVRRLMDTQSDIMQEDIRLLAEAAEHDDPGIREVFAVGSSISDATAFRRQLVFGLVLGAASALSQSILTMAACVTNRYGRGRPSRSLQKLADANPDNYELLLGAMPAEIREALRFASHPLVSVFYDITNGKVSRLKSSVVQTLNFSGEAPASMRGWFTFLCIEGHGSARKIKSARGAYVTDIQIGSDGTVKEFTGSCHFYRIAGHVRPLTAVEAEMARYACRPCNDVTETVIARACSSVASVIERASMEPPDLFHSGDRIPLQ